MRLLVTILVATVLRSQHFVSAQCSRQCSCGTPDGSWSPLYRMLTAPPPSENDIIPLAPTHCSCGCSPAPTLPPRLPSPPPNTPHQLNGVSSLSGVVIDSPGFHQVGPATVLHTPPATYVPSLDSSHHTCDTSSHVMTIPRRQDSTVSFTYYENPSNTITTTDDASPTVNYCTDTNGAPEVAFSSTHDEYPTTTYSTAPQQMPCQPPSSSWVTSAPQPNYPSPPPHALPSPLPPTPPPHAHPSPLPPPPSPSPPAPPPSAPQPMYFPQPAPVYASCPATLFYPAAAPPPPLTCAQPSFVYPVTPSYVSAPAVPTISHSVTPLTSPHTTYSTTDTPSTTYSVTPSLDIPSQAPLAVPYPSPPITAETFQNTQPNTVTCSTSNVQQTPANSEVQQTPSNTVFFSNPVNSEDPGAVILETTGPSVTTHHDSPLTYTLLPSVINSGATDANRDCSVPVPPVLV